MDESQHAEDLLEFVRAKFPSARAGGPRGPWVQMFSGKALFILDVRPGDYDLLDAAHSLSTSTRWGGHAIIPQRTAAHAVGVSILAENITGDPMAGYMGLHHDDPEYAFPDIASPVKHANAIFTAIEDPIERTFLTDLKIPQFYWKHPVVKTIDKTAATDEYATVVSAPPIQRLSKYGRLGIGNFDPGPEILSTRDLERIYIDRHFDLAIKLGLATEKDRTATLQRLDDIYMNHALRFMKSQIDEDMFPMSDFGIENAAAIEKSCQEISRLFSPREIVPSFSPRVRIS